MHQSQVDRDRDNLMLSAARQLLSLSFALLLNFDEIFLCKCSTKSKVTTTSASLEHMPTKRINRERERGGREQKSSYISNNFAVMAAHKKYATKIIFHLRNQSIGISHVHVHVLPYYGARDSSRTSCRIVRVCQRWGHADKIQSLWIYAPLQEMKRKKCAKCIDTPPSNQLHSPSLSLYLSVVCWGCLSVCLPCGEVATPSYCQCNS